MKQAMLICCVVALAILAGCYFRPTGPGDESDGTYLPVPSLPITTIEGAVEWVGNNISYLAEPADHWQAPEETFALGTGDCEDRALLAAFLMMRDCSVTPSVLLGYVLRDGHSYGHVWLSVDGEWFEPGWKGFGLPSGSHLTAADYARPGRTMQVVHELSYFEALSRTR